jgi:uncharacterized RDD family membrane protein YckC
MDSQSAPHDIYLGRAGARTGPYTMDEVRNLVGEGRFTPNDWAWYPGAAQWMALRDVPGFTKAGLAPPAPVLRDPYAIAPKPWQARYAGFWIRLAAMLVDGIILFIPLTILENLLLAERTGDPVTDLGVTLASLALSLGVHWAYRSAFHSSEWQATIGKRAVGIKVMDLQGRRITFAHATGRYFAEFLSGLTLGIGYVMAGISSRKQALHDEIAGTLVIYG